MVPAEFVAQDHAYRMLKMRLRQDAETWGDPINIVELSNALDLSRTPVREALFRLMGEGIIEPGHHGGCRLFRPTADRLRDLYSWALHINLSAIQLAPDDGLRWRLEGLRRRYQDEPNPTGVQWAPSVFKALGDGTGSPEMAAQIENANDRLVAVRLGELRAIANLKDEERRLVLVDGPQIKLRMRKKIRAYFLRRMDLSGRIVSDNDG